jgi:hypothetical protein
VAFAVKPGVAAERAGWAPGSRHEPQADQAGALFITRRQTYPADALAPC